MSLLTKLRQRGDELTITRFSLAELYTGAEQALDPMAEYQAVRRLVSRFRVLDFEDRAARQFARIGSHLGRLGLPIGEMDCLIAAVAIANGERIITLNVRHSSRIPWLIVEPY